VGHRHKDTKCKNVGRLGRAIEGSRHRQKIGHRLERSAVRRQLKKGKPKERKFTSLKVSN